MVSDVVIDIVPEKALQRIAEDRARPSSSPLSHGVS